MSVIDVSNFTRREAARLVPIVATKIDEAGGPDVAIYDNVVTVANEFAWDAVQPLVKTLGASLEEGELPDDEFVLIAREIATDVLNGLKALGYTNEHKTPQLVVEPATPSYTGALNMVIDTLEGMTWISSDTAELILGSLLSAHTVPASEVVKAIKQDRRVVVRG